MRVQAKVRGLRQMPHNTALVATLNAVGHCRVLQPLRPFMMNCATHASAHHRQLTLAVLRRPDHRRGIVRDDAWQRRRVARAVPHGAGEIADRYLAID
ncbi:hypothetical protein VQ042_18495 [Aurantimonas sp. A2-1-M11]|uniref:hypothetical protein n=1 Tax=Aurantimonas sp. A2-1-M11 TaxID=3113712 RepID=UPI002F9435CD